MTGQRLPSVSACPYRRSGVNSAPDASRNTAACLLAALLCAPLILILGWPDAAIGPRRPASEGKPVLADISDASRDGCRAVRWPGAHQWHPSPVGCEMNSARAYRAASLRQSPADWQKIADALDVSHPYALAPFAVMVTERGPRLWAALSPPPLLDAEGLIAWDANPDSDVIEIDWRTGAVALVGEPGGWLCGDPTPRQAMRLFTDGRTFARAWAAKRLAHVNRHRAASVPGLLASDPPDACLPGYVVAGRLDAVTRWAPLLHVGSVILDNPAHVRTLQSLLIRAAGVPTVAAGAHLQEAA